MNLKAKIYMNEVWKPIIGHTNYFISNLGRVRFMHKILNQYGLRYEC